MGRAAGREERAFPAHCIGHTKESEVDIMDRITNHPILGGLPQRKKVTFTYNGRSLEGYEGEPVAAALKANGVMAHRYTAKTHEPRGIFCAIGRCTDCVMVVDGKPNIRTCITPLQAGMKVQTQYGVSPVKQEDTDTIRRAADKT